MKLHLTDEQVAEIWKDLITKYHDVKKFCVPAKAGLTIWIDGAPLLGSVAIENWRELCFERPKQVAVKIACKKCCEQIRFHPGDRLLNVVEAEIHTCKPKKEEPCYKVTCLVCNKEYYGYRNKPGQTGMYNFSVCCNAAAVTFTLINQEKPVNEACLFKRVILEVAKNEKEVIYLGRTYEKGMRATLYSDIENSNDCDVICYTHTTAKRMPGYDYGD